MKSLTLGRIQGIEIKLHPSFVLIALWVVYHWGFRQDSGIAGTIYGLALVLSIFLAASGLPLEADVAAAAAVSGVFASGFLVSGEAAVAGVGIGLCVAGFNVEATDVPGGWLIHRPSACSAQTVSPTSRRMMPW